MREAFGKAVVSIARDDPKMVLLTGDVEQSMAEFKAEFPLRFINVGICEQTMIGVAAGMALEGWRPVVYSITPFVLERPFEQVKIDIDEQNLPVVLIGYSDYPTHGPTHRPLNAPGLVALFKRIKGTFPRSGAEAFQAIRSAYFSGCPAFVGLERDRSKS